MEHKFSTPLFTQIAEFMKNPSQDGSFESLCRKLASFQMEQSNFYANLCALRDWTPQTDTGIEYIPAVPARAFKQINLTATADSPGITFETSGTTSGPENKGKCHYTNDDLVLMDTAIDISAQKFLFPDAAKVQTSILVLAPNPAQAPKMIMVYGMQRLCRNFGDENCAFLVNQNGLDLEGLVDRLNRACVAGHPVTLIGASFGFVHLIDHFLAHKLSFKLPAGSRIMDAGGFKTKSREVTREKLLNDISALFGVPQNMCVNLLGMTEFASQFYDDSVMCAFTGQTPKRLKQNSAWNRTWAVNPETLETLPHNKTGLLKHLDLANGTHPFIVQTDDIGYTTPDGFEILGRAKNAGVKGCSLTVAELTNKE